MTLAVIATEDVSGSVGVEEAGDTQDIPANADTCVRAFRTVASHWDPAYGRLSVSCGFKPTLPQCR